MALDDLSDEDFTELYGAWAPHTPQDAAELLEGYGGSWWVVGGWAAQAFTGAPRPHDDVDIAIGVEIWESSASTSLVGCTSGATTPEP